MIFWAEPVEQWIFVEEEAHHKHPWGVYVGAWKRAQFTTEKEARALADDLTKAFKHHTQK